jgi:hypothetical protein
MLFSVISSCLLLFITSIFADDLHELTPPKFAVIGASDYTAGNGNSISYYPFFALYALTVGRTLVINDDSGIGQMCKVINCGIPMYSEVARYYPDDNVHWFQFHHELVKHSHAVGDANMPTFVGCDEYAAQYIWYNHIFHEADNKTFSLITKETGCNPVDISCIERVLLNRLFPGPINDQFQQHLIDMLNSTNDNLLELKQQLSTLPREQSPHIDVAVHLRNEFHSFERELNENHRRYVAEVDAYLNSSFFKNVVNTTVEKIVELLTNPLYCKRKIYSVFIAGDNHRVNAALRSELEAERRVVLEVMMIRQEGEIAHISAVNHDMHVTAPLAYDWYLICMANYVLGFRIFHGHGGILSGSSFSVSAELAGSNVCLDDAEDYNGHILNPRGFLLANTTSLDAEPCNLFYRISSVSDVHRKWISDKKNP